MKRITFLTQYYVPEMGAPPARISETAIGLAQRGHIVNVITAVPNRPEGRINKDYQDKYEYRSVENEVSVIRVGIYLPRMFGDFVNRLITEASFIVSVLIFAFGDLRSSDTIVIQNPPLFSGMLSFVLKFLTKAKVVNWCSDVWPDLHVELGTLTEKGVITKVMRLMQKISLVNSDAVAVTTKNSVKQVKAVYGAKKCFLWPNGVDTSYFYPHVAEPKLRESWGVNATDFLVGYAGLHGNFQNLHTVLDAAKLLASTQVKFVLIGSGAQKSELVARVAKERIENVIMGEALPRREIPNALQAFDVLIVPLAKPMPSTIPSKFYECLSSGKPLMAVADSEISAIVEEYKLGSVYDCGNADSLAKQLKVLSLADDNELAVMANNARNLAFEYDRKKIITRIQENLNDL